MQHFLVFGSHPRLSLAEFKAIKFALPKPTLCGAATVVDDPEWDGDILMNRLGGTVKLGDVAQEVSLEDISGEVIGRCLLERPRGERILFGLNVFGASSKTKQRLEKLALETKRWLQKQDRSVRWVTSEGGEALSPAAVAKLDLIREGYDVVLLVHEGIVSIGLTTHVQDATAWSTRDYGRPVRDDENGMLPPKLARMMVNLAQIPRDGRVSDPFCGSGTVLMEAALATHAGQIMGSDIEERQVASSQKNIAWLIGERILRPDDEKRIHLFTTDIKYLNKHVSASSLDAVVTEGSLGPPLTGHETQNALTKNAGYLSGLWRNTFSNLNTCLKPGGRVVCVWPSFKSSHGTARVELDHDPELLKNFSIVNPLSDWDTTAHPLLYHRPGQHVMRRIVVLERK